MNIDVISEVMRSVLLIPKMHRAATRTKEIPLESPPSLPYILELNRMAEAILDHLTAINIFDLRGVVAVVTGGGTVSPLQGRRYQHC